MQWKAPSFLPPGISVYPRFDTQLISGAVSKLTLFPPNPNSTEDADNNYIQNPFPGSKNIVALGLSLSLTAHTIKDDSANSIDAGFVVNSIFDTTLRLDSNGGREQKILEPITSYMNFAQTRSNVALIANTAPAYVAVSQYTIQATGPRQFQNLFFFDKQEAFKMYLEWPNSVTFPTTANWTASDQFGRAGFGIKAVLWCADMNDQQTAYYNQKLAAASQG